MSESSTSTGSRRRTWVTVVIPAGTFVVGLLLGWVVVAAGHEDAPSSTPSAGSSAPSSPSSSGTGGATVVTVPGACREASSDISEAARLLRQTIGSVRDFKPDQIVAQLNRIEDLDRRTRPLLDECQQVQVSRSPTPSGSPTPSPSS